MSSTRILAGTLAVLLLAACSGSPTSAAERGADGRRPASNTTSGDSTQTVAGGHTFGSGT